MKENIKRDFQARLDVAARSKMGLSRGDGTCWCLDLNPQEC
jgi:hypothetical protein